MVKFSKQEQADFNFWKQDGNVSKNNDGTYSTQDAQYTNSLKDMDALKEYYFKEFLSGSRYAGGGEVEYEIKRIVNEAKNHKKNTHFAIHKPTNSIVFTWDYNNYDTKELNAHKDDYFYFDVKDIVSGNVDKYVKSVVIYTFVRRVSFYKLNLVTFLCDFLFNIKVILKPCLFGFFKR